MKPSAIQEIYRSLHCFSSSFSSRFSNIAPGFAGIMAPFGGSFFDLNVSQICSIVTHSTPSLVLMYSMILPPISTCRFQDGDDGLAYLSSIISP